MELLTYILLLIIVILIYFLLKKERVLGIKIENNETQGLQKRISKNIQYQKILLEVSNNTMNRQEYFSTRKY